MTTSELNSALATGGITLPPEAVDKLCIYADMLIEQNRTMNLIGPATESELATRHFLDSLAPLMFASDVESELRPVPLAESQPIPHGCEGRSSAWNDTPFGLRGDRPFHAVDVGTGAGLPGMVLAIALPNLRVTLCDSLAKRTAFLSRVAETLNLQNVEVLTARAEELGHTDRRESFDFATARAVTATSALCELCLPLLRVGGTLLAYKTARAADEIAAASGAARKLGGKLLDPFDYTLVDSHGEPMAMRLQPIRKTSPTPTVYPRPWGKIKNQPL